MLGTFFYVLYLFPTDVGKRYTLVHNDDRIIRGYCLKTTINRFILIKVRTGNNAINCYYYSFLFRFCGIYWRAKIIPAGTRYQRKKKKSTRYRCYKWSTPQTFRMELRNVPELVHTKRRHVPFLVQKDVFRRVTKIHFFCFSMDLTMVFFKRIAISMVIFVLTMNKYNI